MTVGTMSDEEQLLLPEKASVPFHVIKWPVGDGTRVEDITWKRLRTDRS